VKIYCMSATFGKLEHETLSLEPGLNVIEAPNEWGKSTWCAFLLAMLYGIDTKERSTLTALAAKERYAPWSGSPMSGRIDLHWNGKDITIERRTKGRAIFGAFRAYETETGLDIPQLTGANCGETLLGVEKEVFARSGFLKLTDLPVTNDQALRRRLNALVTTGDESGTSDTLAQNLRDLRNKVRYNKSGLLPQAEAQREALNAKLRQIQDQKFLHEKLTSQLKHLEQEEQLLVNHAAALEYNANRAYMERLEKAVEAQETAQNRVNYLEGECASYGTLDEVENAMINLEQLRSDRDYLMEEQQALPPLPEKPELPAFLQELDRQSALNHVQTDLRVYQQAVVEKDRRLPGILGALISLLAGGLCLLIHHWVGIALCALGVVAACFILRSNQASRKRAGDTARAMAQKYAPHAPENWEKTITELLDAQQSYAESLQAHNTKRAILDAKLEELEDTISEATGGMGLAQCEQHWQFVRGKLQELVDAEKELFRTRELEQALRSAHKEVLPPQFPDSLTLSEAQTQQQLQICRLNLKQTHIRLGQVAGEMGTLGQEEQLRQQLDQLEKRISKLEDTYAALTIAMDTLSVAASELQRRFSPRISHRAQELFSQLTGGRYERISLAEDLSISAGAQGEDTLHGSIWRSDGTIDQLYLALRLAVAEELTPEAPLVLDDALVRFDDARLASAIDILKTYAQEKQVILFTCQSREKALL